VVGVVLLGLGVGGFGGRGVERECAGPRSDWSLGPLRGVQPGPRPWKPEPDQNQKPRFPIQEGRGMGSVRGHTAGMR